MPRLFLIAAVASLSTLWGAQAFADTATSASQGPFLTWPGKNGQATRPAADAPAGRSAVALPKQFFGGAADIAAPPGLLMPHPVPGTASVTNSSTANTAANRARGDMLTPTGDDSTVQ